MSNPTELTEEQEKAWKSLKRAVKKCEKSNIYWYQVLDLLHAFNGNLVDSVDDHCDKPLPNGAFDLTFKLLDSIPLTCSFADDNHHVILK